MSEPQKLSAESEKDMMEYYLKALDANDDKHLTGEEQAMAVKIMLETLQADGDPHYDEIFKHQKTIWEMGPNAMAEYLNNMLREMMQESNMTSMDVKQVMPGGIEWVEADHVLAVLTEVFES